jgi:hypothetical protein
MPGGGYVEVEMDATYDSNGATMRWHGRVIVERRSETSRRFGNEPPVVAAIDGDDAEELLADLFRLARDNAALARGLLRRQSTRLRAD